MSMYFVGIDISKYKHDSLHHFCSRPKRLFPNLLSKTDKDGFEHLLTTLNSLQS